MDNKQKGVLAIAIAAGIGGMTVAGDASAATYSATLKSAALHTSSAVSGSNLNLSSSTGWVTGTAGGQSGWTYDDVSNLMTQGAGLLNVRSQTAPTSTLFRQSITGLVIGNGGAASATSFVCTEGNFGGNVNASICGNYTFGGNGLNDSTTSWGPGTAVSRILGGDDAANGVTGVNDAVQSIADLNGMKVFSWVGNTLILDNRVCNTLISTNCNGTSTFNLGYRYTFDVVQNVVPVPAAVWLFGSALGLLGVARRQRKA